MSCCEPYFAHAGVCLGPEGFGDESNECQGSFIPLSVNLTRFDTQQPPKRQPKRQPPRRAPSFFSLWSGRCVAAVCSFPTKVNG